MRPPHFWTIRHGRDAAPVTRALLTPLSWLYGTVVQHKLRHIGVKASIPVICVGNLTLGGTGKTPVVRHLAQELMVHGHHPAVLSRGYGGRLKGPVWVDSAIHTAADVGDEPLMLSQTLPVVVSKDRAAGVRFIGTDFTHIILDDGMQNPGVRKDNIIVVIDGATGFGNHHLFPAGPLREPITSGLARADLIVVMGDGDADQNLIAASGKPVIRARLEPSAAPPSGPLVAFAGIGRPEKFFDSLRASGGDMIEAVPFPDHHSYTAADIQRLDARAQHHKAQLITTEKDWVRLPKDMRAGVAVFAVEAELDQALTGFLDVSARHPISRR